MPDEREGGCTLRSSPPAMPLDSGKIAPGPVQRDPVAHADSLRADHPGLRRNAYEIPPACRKFDDAPARIARRSDRPRDACQVVEIVVRPTSSEARFID